MMMTHVFRRALAAVAFLLLAMSAHAASSPAQPGVRTLTVGQAFAEAKSLLADGKAQEALAFLRALPRDGRRGTEILFQTGLAAMAAAEKPGLPEDQREALLDEAVAALRAILVARPDLVRVRLELARAFFLKGEDDLSRRHFEQVLAGNPPPAVALNVRRFLSIMRERRRWSSYFGLSIAPDTNINGASDSDIIYLDTAFGRLPFRRDASTQAQSGVGLSAWGGGEYQHPLGDRVRLRAGADAALQQYKGRRFDQNSLGLRLGPRWLVDADTDVSLLGEVSRQWSAGRINRDDLGARIEAEYQPSRRLSLHADASWRERDYRRSEAFDGPVASVSAGVRWSATPILRVRATLGYERERPESEPWHNDDVWGRLGASVALPKGFTVGASWGLRRTRYAAGGRGAPHFTDDNRKRSDRLQTLRASVFNRAFTVVGFSPQLVLVREILDTNAQTRDYKRNRAEFRFIRQF